MDPDPYVRKSLISTVLRLLYDFLSLKTDVNVQMYRSADPDPYQSVNDPQHCEELVIIFLLFQFNPARPRSNLETDPNAYRQYRTQQKGTKDLDPHNMNRDAFR